MIQPSSKNNPWWTYIGVRGFFIFISYAILAKIGLRMKGRLFPIKLKKMESVFYARFGASDVGVFNQIFAEQEYACIRDVKEPKLIIDCGANVGYSSLWFLQRYPHAKLIAVEPDSANFNLCKKNLQPFGNQIILVQAGVWPVDAGLIVEAGKGGKEWAFQVRECLAGEKPHLYGVSIEQLLAKAGAFKKIDILKIDIETSEKILFAKDYESWLNRVKNIVIELHGPECEDVFFKAMAHYDYDLSRSGELTVCKNIARKVSLSSRASIPESVLSKAI